MPIPERRMLRAIIVDDETLSREKVARFLKECGDVDLLGEATNAAEARRLILRDLPDVVFIDIRLPDVDGLTMAKDIQDQLGAGTPQFIVSSAYDQYALRALEVHVVDYLVKPFSRARFHSALGQVKARIGSMAQQRNAQAAAVTPRRNVPSSRITLRHNGKLLLFDTREIYYIRAADNYIQLHTIDKVHLFRGKLNEIEEQLAGDTFLRIHRSILVNMRYLREVDPSTEDGDACILLSNGTRLPLSRTCRGHVLRTLQRAGSS